MGAHRHRQAPMAYETMTLLDVITVFVPPPFERVALAVMALPTSALVIV